jgi:tetratricopeptide (TPR) repeat protein
LKSAINILCTLLLLALTAQGAQLTSVQSSYHAYGNFAILVLRFDDQVRHEVQATAGGSALIITIPDCKLTPAASADLKATRNQLQKGAHATNDDKALVLRLEFTQAMKVRISDTNNPHSVILDLSPAPGSDSTSSKKTAEIKSSPATKTENIPSHEKFKPGSADYYLDLGKQALAAKNERTALNNFGKVLRLQPDNAQVHYLLGLLQRKWGQPQSAITHFLKAKSDSAYLPQAAIELASLYHQMGRTADEVAQWEDFFTSMKKAQSLPDSLPDIQETTALPVDTLEEIVEQKPPVESPPIQIETLPHTDSLATTASLKPEKSRSIMDYLMYVAVAFLAIVVVMLYLRQRELQDTLTILLTSDEKAEEEPAPPRSARSTLATSPGVERAAPPPSTAVETQGAEDTAREVLGLYRAGMSIPNIAEKLSLGQDEVKLILNLQREERKTELERA